jgi:hypothetical protein
MRLFVSRAGGQTKERARSFEHKKLAAFCERRHLGWWREVLFICPCRSLAESEKRTVILSGSPGGRRAASCRLGRPQPARLARWTKSLSSSSAGALNPIPSVVLKETRGSFHSWRRYMVTLKSYKQRADGIRILIAARHSRARDSGLWYSFARRSTSSAKLNWYLWSICF